MVEIFLIKTKIRGFVGDILGLSHQNELLGIFGSRIIPLDTLQIH
jgi:hypothetical protein